MDIRFTQIFFNKLKDKGVYQILMMQRCLEDDNLNLMGERFTKNSFLKELSRRTSKKFLSNSEILRLKQRQILWDRIV